MPGKKVMMVLPPVRFDGEAFLLVRRILEERGHKVFVTSIGPVATAEGDGMSVPADVDVGDIKTYDYDAYVFLGGNGASIYFDDQRVRKLVQDVKWKTIGATGEAPVILALADAVSGKRVTGSYRFAGLLSEHGATFTNQPLEVDEKIITLQDNSVSEQFANAIAAALEPSS